MHRTAWDYLQLEYQELNYIWKCLKYKGDIPLVAYIDFETTASTDDSLDPESKKMYAVSYVIILAFHPKLKLCRVIVEIELNWIKLLDMWTIKF